MVDRGSRNQDHQSVPTISELIQAQMDATGRSYRDLWRASGERVKHQTFQELRNAPPKSFPKNVETVRGMALALDVTETAVVLAYAKSLGIDVQGDSMLALQLPASAVELGSDERNAIVALVRAITKRPDPGGDRRMSGTDDPPADGMTWHGKHLEEMTDDEVRAAAAVDPVWADYVRTKAKADHAAADWDF